MGDQYKRDFGSFHTSNVQELLTIPDAQYAAPSLPFEIHTFTDYADKNPVFGKTTKERHFYLDESVTFLNHGAFGGVLKQALEDAQKWQVYIERQPLCFFDREIFPYLVYVTRELAKFVDCAPTDLVLLPNVTTGVNAVIRSLDLKTDDIVYRLNIEYGAVKKITSQICLEKNAVVQEEYIKLPLDDINQITELVQATLKPKTRIAIFDHIPSNTPFIMPIKRLIEICHEKGVKVLIDGAHALGSLPLSIQSLDADYYVTNAHKWFCSPKGVALLYVKESLQTGIHPLVISHGFGSGFNSEFMWSGLRDYSPFLAMLTVLKFWNAIGLESIKNYTYNLAHEAANLLTNEWNTRTVVPLKYCSCMVLVELPPSLYSRIKQVDYSAAEKVQNQLYAHFNIEVPIKAVQGVLYVRISAHIYNELSEYKTLLNAINQIQL